MLRPPVLEERHHPRPGQGERGAVVLGRPQVVCKSRTESIGGSSTRSWQLLVLEESEKPLARSVPEVPVWAVN